MNIQVLPNWCKKVGVVLFLVFSFIGGVDGFRDGFFNGYNAAICKCEQKDIVDKGEYYQFPDGRTQIKSAIIRGKVSDGVLNFVFALSGLALLLILLSKEKIEDEYIKTLRLEAFQLVTIGGLLFCFLLTLFDVDAETYVMYIIYLYVIFYLLLFNVKLRISKND